MKEKGKQWGTAGKRRESIFEGAVVTQKVKEKKETKQKGFFSIHSSTSICPSSCLPLLLLRPLYC